MEPVSNSSRREDAGVVTLEALGLPAIPADAPMSFADEGGWLA